MKHCSKFAEDYASYRPSYPRELLNNLTTIAQLGPGRVVADVGSGTGILTRQLLESGARVIGIEPNAAMRDAGIKTFSAIRASTAGPHALKRPGCRTRRST